VRITAWSKEEGMEGGKEEGRGGRRGGEERLFIITLSLDSCVCVLGCWRRRRRRRRGRKRGRKGWEYEDASPFFSSFSLLVL